LWACEDGITWTRCHATTEIMQSESAPAAVAVRDAVSLDIASLGQSNLGKASLGNGNLGNESLGTDNFGNDNLGNDSLGKDSVGQDSLGQYNLGKGNDQDKGEATEFETGAISARSAETFSGRFFVSAFAGNSTGIWADFWAGEASIGRVDGIVDCVVLDGVVLGIDDRTIAGGAKSSTTPITMDELYDGDTTPALLWKRSMTRRRWRWFRSAMES
jgi:hypothetical protein